MINCLIIDDEDHCRESLLNILASLNFNHINVVGEASNISEAYDLINRFNPQLIFLDVEMPRGSGFELLKKFQEPYFDVIFTTAYDSYALQAIKSCALDYIMKPVSHLDIEEAISRFTKRNDRINIRSLDQIMRNLEEPGYKKNRIALKTTDCIDFVEVDSIVHCFANGNYTEIYFNDGSKKLVVGKIKEFEQMLTRYDFLRVHNSHLVNLTKVKKYIKKEGGYLRMENGEDIPISRRKRESILHVIGA